jgi:hypothetical protein
VDDLFGMAELTGDAPLSNLDPAAQPAAASKPGQQGGPGFGDLGLDLDDLPSVKTSRPAEAISEPAGAAAPSPLDPPAPPPAPAGALAEESGSLLLDDAFSPTALGADGSAGGIPPLDEEPAKSPETVPRTEPQALRSSAASAPSARPAEIAPVRAMLSSALTGLLGAALALVVVIASALSDDGAAGWLGFGPAAEVIATGVVSGLYDTSGGKPVFYVRGRVENRTNKVRGPVRITAELIADGTPEVKAEAIAGAEPTPEDVWSVRSPTDAERLSRTLKTARVERKLAPGATLPFFAVIPEPPADLQLHRLRVRVETVDGWTPPAAKAARER